MNNTNDVLEDVFVNRGGGVNNYLPIRYFGHNGVIDPYAWETRISEW